MLGHWGGVFDIQWNSSLFEWVWVFFGVWECGCGLHSAPTGFASLALGSTRGVY